MPRQKREPLFNVERGQTKYLDNGVRDYCFALYRNENADRFTFDFMIVNRYTKDTVFEVRDCTDEFAQELYELCLDDSEPFNLDVIRAFVSVAKAA